MVKRGRHGPAPATVAIVINLAVASVLMVARQADSHPLHTSLAEIFYDSKQSEMQISIRVFADDFSRASHAYGLSTGRISPAYNRTKSSEIPALAYARYAFVVADASGHRLPLAYCGGKRVADLIWLCFHSSAPRGLAGFQVSSTILFDLYPDQVNVVQARYGGKKVSLLFTRGEGFKRLE